MNGLEKMAKVFDDDIDSSRADTRRGKNIAGTLYALAAQKMDELKLKMKGQIKQPQQIPPEGTLDFVKAGMSDYYRDSSGEAQEELQRGLDETQDRTEYNLYLRRDPINNNKEILNKKIDIKDKIDYSEPETIYPIKDKDPRIAEQPQQPEFHEPDRDDSDR